MRPVCGEGFAVDASLIVADANKQRSIPGAQWNKQLDAQAVSRATKEYRLRSIMRHFGAASEVTPKFVSPSDPAAQSALNRCLARVIPKVSGDWKPIEECEENFQKPLRAALATLG
jgi:hypothetical protein